MRVGQKNGLVYQWAKKGTRPRQTHLSNRVQGYENIRDTCCDVWRAVLKPRPYA